MKNLVLLLSALPMACLARDTNRYDSARTEDGVTYTQRGGMAPSNEVVTAIDFAVEFRRLGQGVAKGSTAFKNAVAAVLPDGDFVLGAARPLPKYLHELSFDDCYPDDAAWYYSRVHGRSGSCSAVRDGNVLSRNFDWMLDDAADFVVRVSRSGSRFASVGVANCGTNLSETFVTSGEPSRFYKCLPGSVVDGINENGVVAEVNVVDGDPHESGWPSEGPIHCLGAVRWVLDNATNAASAASSLAAGVFFPSGRTQNLHWMVADGRETWIVENGKASNVVGRAVLTNYTTDPVTYGPGWERCMLLQDTWSDITNAWYTRAYAPDTEWTSEFRSAAEMASAKAAWASHDKEDLRGKGLWQTVHTSVYDITNRVLRIAVQETDDWYVFALKTGGGKVDWSKVEGTPTTLSGYGIEDGATKTELESGLSATNDYLRTSGGTVGGAVTMNGDVTINAPVSVNSELTVEGPSSLIGMAHVYGGMSVLGDVSVSGEHALSDYGITDAATKTDLVQKRDLVNNVCAANSFTQWRDEIHGELTTVVYDEYSGGYTLQWKFNGVRYEDYWVDTGKGDGETRLEEREYESGTQPVSFRFVRSPIATSNELYVTESFVTNAINAAKPDLTALYAGTQSQAPDDWPDVHGQAGVKYTRSDVCIGRDALTRPSSRNDSRDVRSVAVGTMAAARADATVAVGARSVASNKTSVAVGYCSRSTGYGAVSVGAGANSDNIGPVASGDRSIAIGSIDYYLTTPPPTASATMSVAIGSGAVSEAEESVQIGVGTNATPRTLSFLGNVIADERGVYSESYSVRKMTLQNDLHVSTANMMLKNFCPTVVEWAVDLDTDPAPWTGDAYIPRCIFKGTTVEEVIVNGLFDINMQDQYAFAGASNLRKLSVGYLSSQYGEPYAGTLPGTVEADTAVLSMPACMPSSGVTNIDIGIVLNMHTNALAGLSLTSLVVRNGDPSLSFSVTGANMSFKLTGICGADVSRLRNVDIPGVTSLPNGAFSGFSSTSKDRRIRFGDFDELTSIGNFCFNSGNSIESIGRFGKLGKLSPYAFASCVSLRELIAPCVTNIAFGNACRYLQNVRTIMFGRLCDESAAVGGPNPFYMVASNSGHADVLCANTMSELASLSLFPYTQNDSNEATTDSANSRLTWYCADGRLVWDSGAYVEAPYSSVDDLPAKSDTVYVYSVGGKSYKWNGSSYEEVQ